jgi:hypothetical protein
MYKVTHASEVGGFVQTLHESGKIFILGNRISDEFAMKLEDISIELMDKTRQNVIKEIKANSDNDLVHQVNSVPHYQNQFSNWE